VRTTEIIQHLSRYGFWAAITLLVLSFAWIISLALAPVPGTDASTSERISFLGEHEAWHIVNFGIVVPMGLVHVPLWFALAAISWPRKPAIASMIAGFGVIYAPLTVIGYWTQLTTLRGIVELYETEPDAAIALFELIEFSSNPWSLSYGLVVLGYGVWGLGALAVFGGLIHSQYRLARVTGTLFGVSGAFGVIGAIGFAAGNAMLELGVLFSGVVFIPALVGVSVLLHQVSNGLDLDQTSSGR
jgi:hypothetical protein